MTTKNELDEPKTYFNFAALFEKQLSDEGIYSISIFLKRMLSEFEQYYATELIRYCFKQEKLLEEINNLKMQQMQRDMNRFHLPDEPF